jgi:hypothetical protein
MKRTGALMVLLFIVLFVGGLAWKFIEADKCLDAGGMVVGSFMREQSCVMAKPSQ